jgi:FtsH-binding integral membrane protein
MGKDKLTFKQIRAQGQIEKDTNKIIRTYENFIAGCVLYVFTGLLALLSEIYPLTHNYYQPFLIYCLELTVTLCLLYPMSSIREEKNNRNLFKKYINTPVDLRLLLYGKFYLLWKAILQFLAICVPVKAIICFAVSVSIRDPWILLNALTPIIGAFICGLLIMTTISINYASAKRQLIK